MSGKSLILDFDALLAKNLIVFSDLMDNRGFIFTFDAILALIPVFIVLMAVSSVGQGDLILPSQQIRLAHQGQDSMDQMAQYRNSDGIVLEEIVMVLKANHNSAAGIDAAGKIAGEFLDKNLPGMSYKLIELNQLNGTTITSHGDMADAKNVAVGSRSYGNYSFQLYVWDPVV